MQTSPEIAELVKALVKARADFKPVLRDTTGQVGQNRTYKYADLAGVIDATDKALADNGLVLVQAVTENALVSRLCHESGQWLESAYPLRQYDRPQEFGSQLTYARRYSMFALLGVAQEDDDGAQAQEAKPSPKPTQARADGLPPEGMWFGQIQKVSEFKGTNAKGPWTLYTVRGGDGSEFGTFSDSFAALARNEKGEVAIQYKPSRKGGHEIVSIEPVEDEPREASHG